MWIWKMSELEGTTDGWAAGILLGSSNIDNAYTLVWSGNNAALAD